MIDRNDIIYYFYSQARARRSFGALKIAFVCFTPYQNACCRVIFYAIKNLKLLRIFSRFIGFNAIFSCFFLGLHNPTAVPPLQSCPTPTSKHSRPPTTVSTHSGHCLDIVYLCLHPPAPNDSPLAGPALKKGCHRRSPVTGEVPAGCLQLHRLFPVFDVFSWLLKVGLAQGLFKTPLEEMTTLDSVESDGGEEGDVTGDIGDDEDSGDEELEGCNDDDDEDDI